WLGGPLDLSAVLVLAYAAVGGVWISVLSLLLIASCGVCLLGGAWLAWRQHDALVSAETRPVRVERVDVKPTPWGTYRPVTTVVFEREGRREATSRWAYLNVGGTRHWAEASAAQLQQGAAAEVWVDPDNPEAVWVDPTPAALPASVMLIGGLGLGGWVWRRRENTHGEAGAAPPAVRHGWQPLGESRSMMSDAAIAWGSVAIWGCVGLTVVGHHYVWLGGPLDLSAVLVLAYAAVGGVWIAQAWRRTASPARAIDVDLRVNRPTLCLDRDLVARVKLSVEQRMLLRCVRVALVCRQAQGWADVELYRSTAEDMAHGLLDPSRPLQLTHGFGVPPRKRRPSGPTNAASPTHWAIEITIEPQHGAPTTRRYPIEAVRGEG
ncbi:MAG: DUF3592 domain-containing protein, partial [Planctomycetota bacterium]